MAGIAETLWAWTPFLAGGFAGNLVISVGAMLIGTVLGAGLGRARDAGTPRLRGSAAAATGLCRNVPSFVLMFYLALVLPVEVAWAGALLVVPLEAKATLALAIPVVGFASDHVLALLRDAGGRRAARPGFLVSWLQYFLIILMASSTASVIGADEIVGRANRLIATDSRPEVLIATYAYVSGWFLLSGLAISGLGMVLLRRRPAGSRPY